MYWCQFRAVRSPLAVEQIRLIASLTWRSHRKIVPADVPPAIVPSSLDVTEVIKLLIAIGWPKGCGLAGLAAVHSWMAPSSSSVARVPWGLNATELTKPVVIVGSWRSRFGLAGSAT